MTSFELANDLIEKADLSDNVASNPSTQSASVWPFVSVILLFVLVLGLYYGSQIYIGWRYNSEIELSLLQLNAWINLLQRLPTLFQIELTLVGGSAIAIALAPVRLVVARQKKLRKRPSGIEDLHGSARWATRDEILASELLPPKRHRGMSSKPDRPFQGVVVGGWQEGPKKPFNFLKDNGKNHILAFAPTRMGKGGRARSTHALGRLA